jgi:hypothetical protein
MPLSWFQGVTGQPERPPLIAGRDASAHFPAIPAAWLYHPPTHRLYRR